MNYLEKYGYLPQAKPVENALAAISASLDQFNNKETLTKCLSCIDLTSLGSNDSPASTAAFADKMVLFAKEYPQLPLPGSLCVFPDFVSVVSERVKPLGLHTTAASGAFPFSHNFLAVKELECRLSVENGADEVDVLLPLGSFADGDYAAAYAELVAMRAAIDSAASGRKIVYKVILESGLLPSLEAVATASFIAMEAGADFIKTSTGKTATGATLPAAYVMCNCIKAYYAATGRKVGFKPAGGISTVSDALGYYAVVSTVLGPEWLNPSFFRIGTSRIFNLILSELEGKDIKFL